MTPIIYFVLTIMSILTSLLILSFVMVSYSGKCIPLWAKIVLGIASIVLGFVIIFGSAFDNYKREIENNIPTPNNQCSCSCCTPIEKS